MKRRRAVAIWIIGALGMALLGIYVWDRFAPSLARRALPKSASEVQESYMEFGTGDFIRVLKARVPREEVDLYATRVGALPPGGSVSAGMTSWPPSTAPWWNPPQKPLYYHAVNRTAVAVGWFDGYVYFSAFHH